MWYVFVAGPAGDKFSQFDESISGGFVGGQYRSEEDALIAYQQAQQFLELGAVILPPFEASDPVAARDYVRHLLQPEATPTRLFGATSAPAQLNSQIP